MNRDIEAIELFLLKYVQMKYIKVFVTILLLTRRFLLLPVYPLFFLYCRRE